VLRSGTSTTKQMIASKGANSYQLYLENNRLTLAKAGVAAIVQSTSQLTDTSRYYHVVATKNGATVKLYVNGADVTGVVTNQTIADNAVDLTLGATNSTTDPLAGVLDEVALYDPALSAATVSDHYRLGRGS
jgi:hypothetical protein